MQLKLMLAAVGFIILLTAGCPVSSEEGNTVKGVTVNLENISSYSLTSVKVNGMQFGDMEPGSKTSGQIPSSDTITFAADCSGKTVSTPTYKMPDGSSSYWQLSVSVAEFLSAIQK